MSDSAEKLTQGAPKKRSFFKKAAWQTNVKADEGGKKDMFSHAHEYSHIVEDEAKRKKLQREKEEEERRRKAEEEERDRKRRKTSMEDEDFLGSGSSKGKGKGETKGRGRTPASPLSTKASCHSPSARYDSLAKSSSSTGSLPRKPSAVIDLGDSDSDTGDSLYRPARSSIPHLPPKTAPTAEESDVEETEDPWLAALEARARERVADKARASPATANGTPAREPNKDAVVQLFITSELPDAKPLFIKIRTSSTLEKARQSWCSQQGFTTDMTQRVFLTWKGNKLFDSTTVIRLGLSLDLHGNVSVEGSDDLYTDGELPKIHLEAWTQELFEQWKKDEAADAAARKKAAEAPSQEEPEVVEAPVQETRKRVILKAKGKPDFKVTVNLDTTFEHLTAAYKQKTNVPDDQPVTLMFDGDRLRPMDTVADAEIEDMDSIDVLFR